MASWNIKARYYEACNCAYGCPCNFNGFPTHGNCEGFVGFEVTEGERDGVDLTGAKVAAAVMWPGAIHEGNGKMAVAIDANEAQQQALVSILTAQDGGLPWEILAATVSDIHGPYFEPIEIKDNGTDSYIKVGDKMEVQLETFKNPVSGEPHEVHTVMPQGFIFTDAEVCTSSKLVVNADGVSFDHTGNNGYYSAMVEWSSENTMAGEAAAGRF